MSTLLETLEKAIRSGLCVTFEPSEHVIDQYAVSVSKRVRTETTKLSQHFPITDHLTDGVIEGAINFLIDSKKLPANEPKVKEAPAELDTSHFRKSPKKGKRK